MRIEARRLDDGRIEFALRERGGDRILPPARYFPAETEAGRWLNASWITVGVGVNAHGGGGHEVRIEARRLNDGRIEFALRERGGERILPPARYFPAEPEAGRWLNASWITVGAGDEFASAPATTPTPTPCPDGQERNAAGNCEALPTEDATCPIRAAVSTIPTGTSVTAATGPNEYTLTLRSDGFRERIREQRNADGDCELIWPNPPEIEGYTWARDFSGIVTYTAPSVWVPVSSTDALTGRRTTGVYSVATSWTNGGRRHAPRLYAICASPTRFELIVDWVRFIDPMGTGDGLGFFAVDGGRVQYFWWSVRARQSAVVENWGPVRRDGPPAYTEEFADAIRSGSDRIVIRITNFDGQNLTATFPIGGFAQAERAHLSCR